MDSSQVRYTEKSVIIHRDENGFGLRVGGQNPVFVDCVHENGAAWKAGVRKDDRIIKVNGTLVRSYDHQRVVLMIQNCTPFVNLTLHSPETIVTPDPSFGVVSSGLQSNELNNSGLLLSTNIANNNVVPNSMKVHSLHQRLHHPHSVSNNVTWLLNIGDDLFQDNNPATPQQQQQQQQQPKNSDANQASPTTHHSGGVSKLIVSGPSPLISSHSQLITSGGKPKTRQNRGQTNTRDNPYYYYKTAPERASEANSCNSTTSSLLSQDQGTSKSAASLSIVRSRSSSKMSTRSTSGKYKARNIGSRIVEDLRSFTMNNSQTTPSSLSTSPSSSDLSDCDDQDSNRIDCLPINNSNSTGSGASYLAPPSVTTPLSQVSSGVLPKPKQTTRRLEIIRELVDTEKTHTERLKHLNDLLYKPIKAEGLVPVEQLKMVFSCHKSLFKIHRQIYKILSTAQQNISEIHQEPLVGKALVEIFEGELGRRLEKAASTFCACQSTNTELLNRFTRKDSKAGEFLAQVANQQMLGRLGIKDLLASCFQRLTKYPLLLDNLLKATPTGSCGIHSKSLSEGSIVTSVASSIVNSATAEEGFNHIEETPAVPPPPPPPPPPSSNNNNTKNGNNNNSNNNNNNNNNSSNNDTDESNTSATANTSSTAETVTPATIDDEYTYERLCISRALHQSRQILIHVNDAVKRAISHNKLRDVWKKTDKNPNLPVINIETQQMLHEGPLTLRLARRSFEVYVLLLTHYLVILTREGQDKYKLKYFEGHFSPIFNIDEHLATRDTATDENGFYLLCKRKDDSRIYEFASQSPAERAKWKEKIHMAQLYNFASVPDDDNTLTRYRELITLDNIEHVAPTTTTTTTTNAQSNMSINDVAAAQPINSTIGHDINVRAQDV